MLPHSPFETIWTTQLLTAILHVRLQIILQGARALTLDLMDGDFFPALHPPYDGALQLQIEIEGRGRQAKQRSPQSQTAIPDTRGSGHPVRNHPEPIGTWTGDGWSCHSGTVESGWRYSMASAFALGV